MHNMPVVVVDREAIAKRIHTLMQDWAENTLDLGAELVKVRETFPLNPKRSDEYPGFMKWCRQHTGLSTTQIISLVKIYEKFGHRRADTRLSQRVMAVLSTNSVPEAARDEAIERSLRGEALGRKQAKEIADKHRLPSPKAAHAQAKAEGRPVQASDGNIYFGTDPNKAKEGEDRRTMVYGVRRALETLGSIQL